MKLNQWQICNEQQPAIKAGPSMLTCMIHWAQGIKAAIHRVCVVLMLHQASIIQNWHLRSRADRKTCHINAEIRYPGGQVDVIINNIHGHGAGIQTDHRLRPGHSIVISFPIHYLEPPIDIEATIKWAGHGAAGLEFKPA